MTVTHIDNRYTRCADKNCRKQLLKQHALRDRIYYTCNKQCQEEHLKQEDAAIEMSEAEMQEGSKLSGGCCG